ncbi:MAG: hypothetical protein QXP38_11730 [Nitrososphaerota archaeon]
MRRIKGLVTMKGDRIPTSPSLLKLVATIIVVSLALGGVGLLYIMTKQPERVTETLTYTVTNTVTEERTIRTTITEPTTVTNIAAITQTITTTLTTERTVTETLTTRVKTEYNIISRLSDRDGDVGIKYLDVVEAWILQVNPDLLQFEMRVKSPIPLHPESELRYLWFIDADNNPSTGQRQAFVGSEYNIRLIFYDGRWQGYVDAIVSPHLSSQVSVFVDDTIVSIIIERDLIGNAKYFTWEVSAFGAGMGISDSADSYAIARVLPTSPDQGSIAEVLVHPSYLFLRDGVTRGQVTAIARDAAGELVGSFSSIKWFADSPSILSVVGGGEVIANAGGFGLSWVTAKIDGILSTNHVKVVIGTVRLLPPILLLSVSDNPRAALSLQVRDAAGNEVTPKRVQFFSSNPKVATVSDTGLITAVEPPRDFGSTPYIIAKADNVWAENAAVIRVTQKSLGLTLDPFWGENIAFYVPREHISGFDYQKIFREREVVRITDLAYELQYEATGVLPFNGGIQFLVNDPGHGSDGTVPCGLAGNPIRLGTDVDKPIHNSCMIVAFHSGSPQWGVFFHEMGHNFLGEGIRIYQFMRSGHKNDWVYSEGLATALGMYVVKMLEERSSTLTIPQTILKEIKSSVWNFGSTPHLNKYLREGAQYYRMTPHVLDDIIDFICERYGYKTLYRFFSIFLPREKVFPFPVDSDERQATLFVAALSAAAGADLRKQFKEWGFPIDDDYYMAIWDEVVELINQRSHAAHPSPVESSMTGTSARRINGVYLDTAWIKKRAEPACVICTMYKLVLHVCLPRAYKREECRTKFQEACLPKVGGLNAPALINRDVL